VGSWIAQFIGHGIFEGRAPALLDSLAQGTNLNWFLIILFYSSHSFFVRCISLVYR